MPRYVLVFRSGMPSSPEEWQKMMEQWNAWMEDLGDALVEPGAGFCKSRFLAAPDRETAAPDPLSGYSIVEAADHDAAIALAAKNPIFSLGGTIEIAPEMKM